MFSALSFAKCIQTKNTGLMLTFGKLNKVCNPGLHLKMPFFQQIKVVSNEVHSWDYMYNVKTKDNVFADIHISLQTQVTPENTEKYYFGLSNPVTQTGKYIQNFLRPYITKMDLDQVYESQGLISKFISDNLTNKLYTYGIDITDVLVNDIVPAEIVSESMNKINATEREKVAAQNEADALYIKSVRQAEADRDRKILQGEGISGQRREILKGYQDGIGDLSHELGIDPAEILTFVTKVQHLDTIEMISKSKNAKTIFINHDTDNVSKSMMQANES